MSGCGDFSSWIKRELHITFSSSPSCTAQTLETTSTTDPMTESPLPSAATAFAGGVSARAPSREVGRAPPVLLGGGSRECTRVAIRSSPSHTPSLANAVRSRIVDMVPSVVARVREASSPPWTAVKLKSTHCTITFTCRQGEWGWAAAEAAVPQCCAGCFWTHHPRRSHRLNHGGGRMVPHLLAQLRHDEDGVRGG